MKSILFIFSLSIYISTNIKLYYRLQGYVVYAFLSYKVGLIQKYWHLTNLWAKIYQIWRVCPYGFCLITQPFFVQSWSQTSYTSLGNFGFGYVEVIWYSWAKMDQIWAWLYHGHCTGARLESRTPLNVWSWVLVCWSTTISETSFTKNQAVPPPPPP